VLLPLGDEYKPIRRPYVNYSLIIINVMIFFYFFLQGPRVFLKSVYFLGMTPINVIAGRRLWTVITSMFIHGSPDHLLGNMLYLFIFGDNVEDILGHAKYLVFYLLSGLGATLIHIATLPPYPYAWSSPALGASGAISGVLAAYMLLFPRVRIKVLTPIFFGYFMLRVPAHFFIGLWFLYQFYAGIGSLAGIPSGIAFWAHIGGFITGLMLVKAMKAERGRYRRAYPVPRYYRV